MKWKIILPLLIALPAVIIAFNEESDDIDEYKRSRRVPMMMPQNYFFKAPLASAFGDEDYDYDSGLGWAGRPGAPVPSHVLRILYDMDRRRRSAENGLEDDDDDEDERRKRNPYFFTTRLNTLKKREMQKRGTPYFFPMWGSSPYARNLRAYFPLRKRYDTKRNLIDAFTRDDPSAFGYDKKKRSSPDEDEERRKRT